MLLFWRTQKRREDKRQEPQGQRDSQQAGERRKPRTCRPSERKRGAGKQPLRLCRVTNKNLPLSRAKRERRSRVGFGAREGEEIDAEQGTPGAPATAPISGAARRRSPNDRRAGNSRTRFQTPTARRGQGARGISSARYKLRSFLEMREGGASTGSAAQQAGSRRKHPEAQSVRKDSDESAANSAGAQGADGGAERSRPTTKRDRRRVY